MQFQRHIDNQCKKQVDLGTDIKIFTFEGHVVMNAIVSWDKIEFVIPFLTDSKIFRDV